MRKRSCVTCLSQALPISTIRPSTEFQQFPGSGPSRRLSLRQVSFRRVGRATQTRLLPSISLNTTSLCRLQGKTERWPERSVKDSVRLGCVSSTTSSTSPSCGEETCPRNSEGGTAPAPDSFCPSSRVIMQSRIGLTSNSRFLRRRLGGVSVNSYCPSASTRRCLSGCVGTSLILTFGAKALMVSSQRFLGNLVLATDFKRL